MMLSTGHDMAVAFAKLAPKMGLKFLEFVGDCPVKRRISRRRDFIFSHTLPGLGTFRGGFGGGFLEAMSI
jgi:hypothetical protein